MQPSYRCSVHKKHCLDPQVQWCNKEFGQAEHDSMNEENQATKTDVKGRPALSETNIDRELQPDFKVRPIEKEILESWQLKCNHSQCSMLIMIQGRQEEDYLLLWKTEKSAPNLTGTYCVDKVQRPFNRSWTTRGEKCGKTKLRKPIYVDARIYPTKQVFLLRKRRDPEAERRNTTTELHAPWLCIPLGCK